MDERYFPEGLSAFDLINDFAVDQHVEAPTVDDEEMGACHVNAHTIGGRSGNTLEEVRHFQTLKTSKAPIHQGIFLDSPTAIVIQRVGTLILR